ncbi:type II toxin-antitoxin system HicA family toxin [Rhizobiaceae bacterium CRRU44]|uniref:Type II toxin-antitoxin system HicA family toxin n=1 Tax=Ferranicluibacter rubi TaxID=2715133 RepID=A0AA43ZC07_9HYPH|nr:type II toxin-antitoxin system HicA family toxin [Ferranicluibacter rubi]NHT75058.1 type II toxin-antitoxin system HicA family toxin [Ferranicluibacter rubi]PYE28536.1 HicA-like toxin of HicAB toxin-antitoxin system [Rhizobium sp. PP-CC-3A-592]
MGGYLRDLKAMLAAAGCHFHRAGKGDHEIWFSPITKRYFTVDHGVKSRHTANETLKQAGLPKAF